MDIKFGQLYSNTKGSLSASTENEAAISAGNFFLNAEKSVKNEPKEKEKIQNGLRINDFDSNILENNAYQDIKDEVLKLEHKIDIKEKELEKLTQEIETLSAFENEVQLDDLISQKKILENEIAELNKKYSKYGLSAKISGQIANVVKSGAKKRENLTSSAKNIVLKGFLEKISKKFKCSQSMKDALSTLSNINSDVDELVKMNIPYGEKIARYERLTAYLNKANLIHAHIAKDLKTLKG